MIVGPTSPAIRLESGMRHVLEEPVLADVMSAKNRRRLGVCPFTPRSHLHGAPSAGNGFLTRSPHFRPTLVVDAWVVLPVESATS